MYIEQCQIVGFYSVYLERLGMLNYVWEYMSYDYTVCKHCACLFGYLYVVNSDYWCLFIIFGDL